MLTIIIQMFQALHGHLGVARRLRAMAALCAIGLALAAAQPVLAHNKASDARVSDAELVRELPGFTSAHAEVNDTRLHYVVGGKGVPLLLLPGWPQTWWQYRRIMPILATKYKVIAVDLRGMGGSDKPPSGYDKKTLARDVRELLRTLGHEKAYVAGHDIGSMVAFAFAANYPEATLRVALMDVPHPDEFMMDLRMLPAAGAFGAKIDDQHPGYPWWFAFHQVKGLPEALLSGRSGIYLDFLLDYLLLDSKSIGTRDRDVYKAAFARPDAIRAGNAYYQTFMQDAIDIKSYPKLSMPVLALAGPGFGWMQASLPPRVTNFKLVKVENSGHFLAEEQPHIVAEELIRFFQ